MYPYLKIISLLFHSPLIPCFQVLFKNLLNLITIVFANHSLFYLKKNFFFYQRGKNDSLGILTIHLLRLAYIQFYICSLGDSHWAKSKGTIKGQEQITLFAIIEDAFSFLFTYIFSSFLPSSLYISTSMYLQRSHCVWWVLWELDILEENNRFVKKPKRTVLSSFQHALVWTSVLPAMFSFQLKLLWKAEGMVLWAENNCHGFIPWTTEGLAPAFTWLKCENTLAALIYKSLSYITWL